MTEPKPIPTPDDVLDRLVARYRRWALLAIAGYAAGLALHLSALDRLNENVDDMARRQGADRAEVARLRAEMDLILSERRHRVAGSLAAIPWR